ncbi:hypothetical protein AB0878_46370 [Amycolatopsis sp. NPDC047767]|uniref:hypothetical protein n=1 Tax=Amycolatopsis sp. NPDC047767 TaxID=3156765 RepID=UPI0034512273
MAISKEFRGERGDDNVAAIILISALIVVALAVFQVVAVFLGRAVALEAARDGVAAARIPPVDLPAAAARAENYTGRATGTWLDAVGARASSDGRIVWVTVTAHAASFIPFVTVTISQTASGPVERIQP